MLMLAACGGSGSDPGTGSDDPPPPQQPATAVATAVGTALGEAITSAIGPAGGMLESADGTLRVEIPAGALAMEQTISIQPITHHAHGNLGSSFRLGPEDVTFAAPVRLTFRLSPDQIRGTAPQLLRVASQNSQGFWELHEAVTLDAEAGTLAVTTEHFSDWSLVTGAQLSPSSATVQPGGTLELSVVVCERAQAGDFVAPLLAECRPSQVISNLTRNWSVNGTPGGHAQVGTVAVQENRTALYTAPAHAPQPATVAVSTEYTALGGELVMLVADIRIQSGLCTPPSLAEPCRFNLTQINGKGLPYEELPRDPWENLERVISGRLSLRDSDSNGDGTWSLRIHWVEEKQSGGLEQFEQLAGDFTSDAGGQMKFTLPSGEAFTGKIADGVVTVQDYPLSTKNTSGPVQLELREE